MILIHYLLPFQKGNPNCCNRNNEIQDIAAKIKNGGLVCLYGNLGSGKTTYTQKLATALGIDGFKVKSPTYSYIRKYDINPKQSLYHIDLYRLEEPDRNIIEEVREILENEKNIVVIEWADRIKEYLPAEKIEIEITLGPNNQRKIRIY